MNLSSTKKLIGLLVVVIFLLNSCAGKKGKTNSTFKLTLGGISAAYTTGGMMLYGKMLNGPSRFGKRIDASGTATLELNNGNWEFFAIAWDGASDLQVATKLRCANVTQNFAGGDAQVSLNMTNANCANGIYNNNNALLSGSDFDFFNTSIMTCDQNWATPPINFTSTVCDGPGFGAVDSYQISLPEYIDNGTGAQVVSEGLRSECRTTNPSNIHPTSALSGSTANFLAKIPIGAPGSPFLTRVKGYFGSIDCGNSKPARGFIDRDFNQGLGSVPSGFISSGDFRLFDRVFDQEVCSITGGGTVAGDFFSSGNGQGHPYAICSREQFEAFANPTNYNSTLPDDAVALRNANFRLYSDIDFADSAFNGIGDGATAYTGKFDGRKYSVNNIFNMNILDSMKIGLFRYIGGGAAVINLTLRNIFFECGDSDLNGDCSEMGVLAGMVDGGNANATEIKGIKIQGHVFGGQHVGGLVGLINTGTVGTQIHDVHFYGAAEGEPEGTNLANVGGLVGAANGNVSINQSSASCHVYGGGTNAGGLVGSLNSASTIIQSSARCEVRADRVIGGLVGSVGAGSTVINSYAFPNLEAHCDGGCDAGSLKVQMGGLVGVNNGSISNSFTAYASLMMNSGPGSGDAMAYMGGFVGQNLGTCANASNFYSKVNNTGNAFGIVPTIGGGCGTMLSTPATLYSIANYSGNGWTIVNTSGSGPLWNLPSTAEGFDVPRLSWEYNKELEVPYLQRPCEANFNLLGSGSQADPFMICRMDQFLAMTSGNYYKLKRDLEFIGPSITTMNNFSSGVYNLDGDGFSLIGIKTEVSGGTPNNLGLFGDLLAGSKLSNINFTDLTFKSISTMNMGAIEQVAGLLVARNNGIIENIHLDKSELRLALNNSTNVNDVNVSVGGLVGKNFGLIQNIYGGTHVSLNDTNIYFDGGETLYVGGLVGRNDGQIKYSGLHSSVGHYAGATGFNTKLNQNKYATIAAYNNGTIEQVSAEGRIQINNFDDTGAGGHFAGIAVTNLGNIIDSSSNVTFFQSGGGSTSQFAGVAIANSAPGVISRTYYTPSEWDFNDFDGSASFTRPTSLAGVVFSNSATLSDSYCFTNSNSTFPDEGMTGCLDLHPSTPNFSFTASAGGFNFTYDDSSSIGQTISSIGWDVDDDFMFGTSTWTIEDFDRPPKLRISDPFRDEVFNAPPIF